jgi:hypothetical protein
MSWASIQALLAVVAHGIDLTNDALTNPRSVLRLNNLPHKLMTENSRVRVIPLDQFEVGSANACLANVYQRLVWSLRLENVSQVNVIVFEP